MACSAKHFAIDGLGGDAWLLRLVAIRFDGSEVPVSGFWASSVAAVDRRMWRDNIVVPQPLELPTPWFLRLPAALWLLLSVGVAQWFARRAVDRLPVA